jgi:hypothetical protein
MRLAFSTLLTQDTADVNFPQLLMCQPGMDLSCHRGAGEPLPIGRISGKLAGNQK